MADRIDLDELERLLRESEQPGSVAQIIAATERFDAAWIPAAPSLISELRRLRKIEEAARKVSQSDWNLNEVLTALDEALAATGETEA